MRSEGKEVILAPSPTNLMRFRVQLACVMKFAPALIVEMIGRLEHTSADGELWYTDDAMRIAALRDDIVVVDALLSYSEEQSLPNQRYGASLAQSTHDKGNHLI